MRLRNHKDKRFGRLVVEKFLGRKLVSGVLRPFWLCKCDCGGFTESTSSNLIAGNSTSCGCKKIEACLKRSTHGKSGTTEYEAWKKMRERCLNKNCKEYKHYGGRGIRICKRWDKFENFLADLGLKPKGYSLERKKVNDGYKPSNCLWIPKTKQNRNRRDTIRLTYNNVTKTLVDWADELKIPYHRIRMRYYRGLSVEKILATWYRTVPYGEVVV